MRTAKFVGSTFLVFFLFGANAYNPLIRFNSDLANSIAYIVIGCLSLVVLVLSIVIPRRLLTKIFLPILLFPFSCLCVLVCVLGFLGFSPTKKIQMDGYSMRLYVADGGAMDDPALYVRQEMPIGPLLLVREIWKFYPADTATLTVMSKDSVRVEVPAEEAEGERTIPARSKVFHLKPHVYF